MLFNRKAFVVNCVWKKVCWSSSAIVQKFTLAWGEQALIWRAQPRNAPSGAGPVTYF